MTERPARVPGHIRLARQHQLPDSSRHLAWVGGAAVAACDDGAVFVVDDLGPRQVHDVEAPATALAAAGERFAVGSVDGDALLFDDAGEIGRLHCDAAIAAAVADVRHAVFAHGSNVVVTDGSDHDHVPLGIGTITSMTAVAGNLLAVGGVSGLAWFDPALKVTDARIELPTIVSIASDPLRRFIAAGDLGGSLHVIRPGDGDGIELTGYPDRIALIAWLASGSALCVTADDEVTVWGCDGEVDITAPTQLLGHDAAITAIAASPTDDVIATGDASGDVCMWAPFDTGEPVARLQLEGVVLAIAWNETRHELAISTSAGTLARCAVTTSSA